MLNQSLAFEGLVGFRIHQNEDNHMIDDDQADVHLGAAVNHDGAKLDEPMFGAPIMTAEKIEDRIDKLVRNIEALKVIDGASEALHRAMSSVHAAFAYVEVHAAAAAAEVEDDEAIKSMFSTAKATVSGDTAVAGAAVAAAETAYLR
jgi:hypothetical protein